MVIAKTRVILIVVEDAMDGLKQSPIIIAEMLNLQNKLSVYK